MKLKNAEKILRQMIDARNGSAPEPDLSDPSVKAALEYWEGKSCVKLTRDWGGEIMFAEVTQQAMIYFPDKQQSRLRNFWDRIDNFLCGFISGVATSVIGGFILQWLTTRR